MAFKNIVISLIQQVVTVVCGFIVPKLIISNFGSQTNGLISSITQFLSYITLLDAGFTAVIKSQLYKPIADKNEEEIKSILYSAERFFKNIAKIFIIYIIALLILYPNIVSKEYDWLYTDTLIIIISISTFAEYYFGMTYKIFIQTNQQTYIISSLHIITTILNTIGIAVLIRMKADIFMVKLLSSFVFLIRPIVQNYYVKKKYHIDLTNANRDYQIKDKWAGLSQHIASVVHNNTDVTILTVLASLGEVSVYSVYYLVVKGIKNLVSSLTSGVDASFGDMIAKEEIDNLNKKFNLYELFYFTIITIVYSCTILLIIHFVKVYTKGIIDVDYIRPAFGILLVLAELAHAIRLPYSSLTMAAGHFKETMKGAWAEAFLNIFISIFLVSKFGLVGVATGTLVAMIVRTVEFIFHSSKYILKRKIIESIKRILIIIMEVIIVYVGGIFTLSYITIDSYLQFFIAGIICVILSSVIVVAINYLFYRDDFKNIKTMLKRIFKLESKV